MEEERNQGQEERNQGPRLSSAALQASALPNPVALGHDTMCEDYLGIIYCQEKY